MARSEMVGASAALRIGVLVTDAFGSLGGISKFNRDLLSSLSSCEEVEQVVALPRLISESITDQLPSKLVYDVEASRGLVAYLRQLWIQFQFSPLDLIICGHVHLLPFAWAVARVRRIPVTLVIHGIEAWAPTPHRSANLLVGKPDEVLAVSRYSAARFESWAGFPRDRAIILPNSIDLQRFTPGAPDPSLVARYGLQDSKVIMTLGRLASAERCKGFDEVITAMPQLLESHPNLKYLVVGDGPDRPRLAARVLQEGLEKQVVFAGRIPEHEKVAHYQLCDAYVMPSAGEGFGIVLLEAAACGIPVIGSSIDGSREALLDGLLGTLVDPRVPEELIDAARGVLSEGRQARRNPAIELFDENCFHERVAGWLRGSAAYSGRSGPSKRPLLPACSELR